jgi:hypothetical protein
MRKNSRVNYLINRPDAFCKSIGQEMLALYDAPAGSGQGFKLSEQTTGSMSVKMKDGQSTISGWGKADSYIYVRSGGLWESSTVNQVGGLLAHEQAHVWGDDCDGTLCQGTAAHTGLANQYQDSCGSET